MKRFTILAVCTANICRSPMIEILLRSRLDPARFEVASAGVRGRENEPVDSMVALELARLGLGAEGFHSRALDTHLLDEADLVLTATRSHRAEVLAMSPRALRRTFTLREFAALGPADDDAESLEELVATAVQRRGTGPTDVDIQDPYRHGPEVHRLVADQIVTAVDAVADRMSGLFSRIRAPRGS